MLYRNEVLGIDLLSDYELTAISKDRYKNKKPTLHMDAVTDGQTLREPHKK